MIAEANPQTRTCPRCGTEVSAERFRGAEGLTTLWRCACGWCNVVAESGMISRPSIETLEADEADQPNGKSK